MLRQSVIHLPDWGRAMLWTCGVIGGVATIAYLHRPMFGLYARGLGRRLKTPQARHWDREGPDRRHSKPDRPRLLHDAIVGSSREAIIAIFGAPPAVTSAPIDSATSEPFWQAQTWYYPLDPIEKRAMAIRFDTYGRAREVMFIDTPNPHLIPSRRN